MNRITRLLHLENNDAYQAMSMPIYQVSTFNQHNTDTFEYSRIQNPTRRYLEAQLAILDEADGAFALSSGLSALNVTLGLLKVGDEIIVGCDFYAGISFILEEMCLTRGIKVKQLDLQNPESLEKNINEHTKMVLCETVSNPLQRVTPISDIAHITNRYNICLVVDNSLMSSYGFMPLNFGADIAIQSSTKYLVGHADMTSGVLATSQKYTDKVVKIIRQTGYALDPFQSWLLSRSLKTIHLRMDKIHYNTQVIYQYLKNTGLFKAIYYCGDESQKYATWLINNSITLGGLIGVECHDQVQFDHLYEKLKAYFPKTVSFGAVHSSLSHPATMSHKETHKLQQIRLQVSPWLLRLSIGCEAVEDTLTVFQEFMNENKSSQQAKRSKQPKQSEKVNS
ncbi:trans-sulfuration enzyme family protein [Fastidiosibacter lacustris]|uniref:trans-sulfuration enzyme family protein n=1 Tax=Fastidiosibacter lacustris TaxID=2056695 RepID=UPI000E34B851|nr:PLP-dependent aspartate aminotransferase family protein [Fastidiosibacter lacustris]